jgi:hypothetical protein
MFESFKHGGPISHRFLQRVKEEVHNFDCKWNTASFKTLQVFKHQPELDYSIDINSDFVIKSKKIIYLRWREILGALSKNCQISEIKDEQILNLIGGLDNLQKILKLNPGI